MKIEQKKWTKGGGWDNISTQSFDTPPQLVLVFGGYSVLKEPHAYEEVRAMYPKSHILACTTAGEIAGTEVSDDTLSLTAAYFAKTELRFGTLEISKSADSYEVGKKLAGMLETKGLVHAMVFSDGLKVNGTSLVRGLTEGLPKTVSVTGGLVGDGGAFKETLIGFDQTPRSGQVVLIGFYGKDLKIGYGSLGGWDAFGPERTITKSKENVLYEIDNQPALALYKQYLGDQAKDLPGSGLLFPLSLRMKTAEKGEVEIVRTLLAVDEKAQSLTFAGDVPEGTPAKLMKANFERLIDGAAGAANMSTEPLGKNKPELAVLISCIGRKLVLKARVEEEIEAVRGVLGEQAAITGFYSYGEICPTAAAEKQCQLHNQTMTITTFRED